MKKFNSIIQLYAPILLRVGMSAVILWFSIEQFIHTQSWTAYVPDSVVAASHVSAVTLVYVNALFELVGGLMLLFGWQTRIVALLLALHLFDIMYVVGYGEIGVRDFGLAIATLVVSMNGPDIFCLQPPTEYEGTTIQATPAIPSNPLVQPRKLI